KEERADVRILAASNRSLDELVRADRFRMDLLYRLKLMRLVLPPLRERYGDVSLLARHFVRIGATRFGCPARPLGPETLAWFERYAWPGNVRELEHLVYHGLLLSDGPVVTIEPHPSAAAPRR